VRARLAFGRSIFCDWRHPSKLLPDMVGEQVPEVTPALQECDSSWPLSVLPSRPGLMKLVKRAIYSSRRIHITSALILANRGSDMLLLTRLRCAYSGNTV